jgi:CRISPR type I-E-associated protein CasB/Cse2
VTRNGPVNKEGLARWHRELLEDPGQRAEARRAATPADIMLCATFARMISACQPGAKLGETGVVGISGFRIAALARAAFVLTRSASQAPGRRFAQAMASGGARPVVSAARANGLFRTEDEDDACRQMAAMTPLVGAFDAFGLLLAFLDWDKARREWAMEYHLAAHRQQKPAPAA